MVRSTGEHAAEPSAVQKTYLRSIGILILLALPLLIPVFPADDVDDHFGSARFGVDEGKLICLLLLKRSVSVSDVTELCGGILTSLLLQKEVTAVLHPVLDYRDQETCRVRERSRSAR